MLILIHESLFAALFINLVNQSWIHLEVGDVIVL